MSWHFTSIGKTALRLYGGEYGVLVPTQHDHIHFNIPENFSLIHWQTAKQRKFVIALHISIQSSN